MPLLRRAVVPFIVAAIAFASGCDQAPGPADAEGAPPVLSDFTFSPTRTAFSADADAEDLPIPLEMSVFAEDVDGDLETVAYVVQSPFSGSDIVAEGTLPPSSGARFEGEANVTIPAGRIGVYTVLVYAVDRAGSLSNEVRGMLTIEGVGEPPVIEDVEADPEVVHPPDTLTLVATVTDPDGVGNIATVVGTAPNGLKFQMVDDGKTFDDEAAGDGRFRARFNVDAATPGTQTFTFVATDLSGLESDVYAKDIEVE